MCTAIEIKVSALAELLLTTSLLHDCRHQYLTPPLTPNLTSPTPSLKKLQSLKPPSTDLHAPFDRLIKLPRGRNSICILGNYTYCLSLSLVLSSQLYQPHLNPQLHQKHRYQQHKEPNFNSDVDHTDLLFLIFIQALTTLSRYILAIRFQHGLRALPTPTSLDLQRAMHINSILRTLEGEFSPFPSRIFRESNIPPRLLPPLPHPVFREYQGRLINRIQAAWGGPAAMDLDLAYEVLVTRGVGICPMWYRRVEEVFLEQVEGMTAANQPLGGLVDIFWPVDGVWPAVAGGGGMIRGNSRIGEQDDEAVEATFSATTTGWFTVKNRLPLSTPSTSNALITIGKNLRRVVWPVKTPIEAALDLDLEGNQNGSWNALIPPDQSWREHMEQYLSQCKRGAELVEGYWKEVDRKERNRVLGMFCGFV